jgi:hypothetical protein
VQLCEEGPCVHKAHHASFGMQALQIAVKRINAFLQSADSLSRKEQAFNRLVDTLNKRLNDYSAWYPDHSRGSEYRAYTRDQDNCENRQIIIRKDLTYTISNGRRRVSGSIRILDEPDGEDVTMDSDDLNSFWNLVNPNLDDSEEDPVTNPWVRG